MPSNYDIANCRVEGSSLLPNLKSILTHCKMVGGNAISLPTPKMLDSTPLPPIYSVPNSVPTSELKQTRSRE